MGRTALLVLAGALVTAAAASAGGLAGSGPSVESDSVVGSSTVHQEINVLGSDFHYWIRVRDPEGPPPFCVTLELERKRNGRWEGLGIDPGQHRGVRECCPDPHAGESCESSETMSAWDLFVYPRPGSLRKLRAGKLRVRGSTDLGPSLALRP